MHQTLGGLDLNLTFADDANPASNRVTMPGEFECGFRTASVDECTAHEAACSNRPEERAKRAAEAKVGEDERAKKEAAEKAKKKNWACACPLLPGASCLR